MKLKIILNIFWLVGEKGIQIIAGIIISGMLARGLGVELFGAFQYALAMVLLFSSLSFICGMEVVLPRLVNASKVEKSQIVSTAFILRMLSAMLGGVAFIVYMSLSSPGAYSLVTLFLFGGIIILREPFNIIVSLLQARTDEKIGIVIRLLSLCIKLLALWYCYHNMKLTTEVSALFWFIETLIIAIALLCLIRFVEPNFKFDFDLKYSRELFLQGAKFWLGLIFMYLFLRFDRMFLLHFTDLHQVGVYSAAMQISDNLATLAPIVAISAAPILVYSVSSLKKIKVNVLMLTGLMAAIGGVIAVIGYGLSDFIIMTIFGHGYTEAASVLKMTLFVSVLVFIDSGLNTFIIKYGTGKIIILKWLLALLVSLVININFTGKFGVTSVIVANFVGYSVTIIFGLIYLLKFKGKEHHE